MQQSDIFASYSSSDKDFHGSLDFGHFGHPGRHDDLSPFGGNLPKIGEIGYFSGGNLPVIHAEFSQAVNRNKVERGRHESDSHLTAKLSQRAVVLQSEMYFPAHFQLAFLPAGRLLLVFGFLGETGDYQFGNRSLELDVVRAGLFCGVYHLYGAVIVTVMVHSRLRDNHHFIQLHGSNRNKLQRNSEL